MAERAISLIFAANPKLQPTPFPNWVVSTKINLPQPTQPLFTRLLSADPLLARHLSDSHDDPLMLHLRMGEMPSLRISPRYLEIPSIEVLHELAIAHMDYTFGDYVQSIARLERTLLYMQESPKVRLLAPAARSEIYLDISCQLLNMGFREHAFHLVDQPGMDPRDRRFLHQLADMKQWLPQETARIIARFHQAVDPMVDRAIRRTNSNLEGQKPPPPSP